ncbi:MAG: TolB-like translocation protein [Planctomycetota bacterium]|jgi:hypothetical protein
MKRFLLFFIAALAIVILYLVFFRARQADFFTPGQAVIPAPSGPLLAVKIEEGEWGIFEPMGSCLGSVITDTAPLWIEDGKGESFLYLGEEGLSLGSFTPDFNSRLLIPTRLFLPWRALPGGRILLAYVEEEKICGSALVTVPQGEDEQMLEMGTSVSWLGEPPAETLEASPDGRWVSRAVRSGDHYKIGILEIDSGDDSLDEKWVVHRANFAEHFWSWSGRYLLYSSAEGSVELFDTGTGKSRWLVNSSFAPNGLAPFKPCFTMDDAVLFMEMVDRYGYRQIKQFMTATAEASEFTQGGLDHYEPFLSRNGRYLTYRQGKLPEKGKTSLDSDHVESIYIFDLRGRATHDLGDRAMRAGILHLGPVLSGDLRHVYFVKENSVFQYPLLD